MKKILIVLLIVTMGLSLILTGCLSSKENTEVTPNTEASKIDEKVNEESDATSDTDNEVVSEDWTKYEVKSITEEGTNQGVYTLLYVSKSNQKDVAKYYEDLLKGTENYTIVETPTEGTMIKGTMNGKGTLMTIKNDESNKETLIELYIYE